MKTKKKEQLPFDQALDGATASHTVQKALEQLSTSTQAPFNSRTIRVIDLLDEEGILAFSFETDCGDLLKGMIDKQEKTLTLFLSEDELHSQFYINYFTEQFLK